MKLLSRSLLLLLFIGIITSCKKYPDGPSFSLLPKKARLANTWKIEKGFINDVDKTTDFNNTYQDAAYYITKQGRYSLSYNLFGVLTYSESGAWVWSGDKKYVYFTGTSASNAQPTSHKYQILKLKDQELWAKETQSNGDVWEIHFVPR